MNLAYRNFKQDKLVIVNVKIVKPYGYFDDCKNYYWIKAFMKSAFVIKLHLAVVNVVISNTFTRINKCVEYGLRSSYRIGY